MKKIILITVSVFCIQTANAQFINEVKKDIEQTVEKRVDAVLDQNPSITDTFKTSKEDSSPHNASAKNQPNLNKNYITYTSPSEAFRDLTFHSFKGKLRFGFTYLELKENGKKYSNANGYQGFFSLFKLSLRKEEYKELPENYPFRTRNVRVDPRARYKMVDLLWLDRIMSVGENSTRGRYADGFYRGDQFEMNREYKAFVKNELPVLQQWASEIFNGEYVEAYVIGEVGHYLGVYDFEKEGFFLNSEKMHTTGITSPVPFKSGSGSFGGYNGGSVAFDLVQEDGKTMVPKKRRFPDVLFSIKPEAAEKLKNTVTESKEKLYFVRKVRIFMGTPTNGSNSNPSNPRGIFQFMNDNVDLYLGKDLTNKIGQLTLPKAE